MHPIQLPTEESFLRACGRQRRRGFRWMPAGVASLLTLAALNVAAQAPPDKSIPELQAFYQQNCSRCHGPDGSAHSADGKKLGGQDFTRVAKAFKAQSGPASEKEIRSMVRTIQKGIFFGLTMPGWKDQLSEADATRMVREILLQAEAGKPIGPVNASPGSK